MNPVTDLVYSATLLAADVSCAAGVAGLILGWLFPAARAAGRWWRRFLLLALVLNFFSLAFHYAFDHRDMTPGQFAGEHTAFGVVAAAALAALLLARLRRDGS